MNREILKVRVMQTQTEKETLELMRKKMVIAMRSGDNYAVNLGNLKVDFTSEYSEAEIMPTDMVFNRDEFVKEDNYKSLVREDEMYTLH